MNKITTLFVFFATLAVMLIGPSTASAVCNVGITNSVTVMPPTHLYGGQTQSQHYQVTACTVTQKVTVQWVRVLDSSKPFMLDPSNRVDVIAETSQGVTLSGNTSWTAPANVTVGHYAIITRYYAQDGNSWPEATAASSFIVSRDVCANIADDQLTVPAGLVQDGANCVQDVCDNLTGVQTTVPVGLVVINSATCVTDVCDNITGVQVQVPVGLVVVSGKTCVEDVCDNLTGVQVTVPVGLVDTGNKTCVKDVCDNLTGVQVTVPVGLTVDGGNCVKDVCDNLTGIQLTVPTGLVLEGGDCVHDVCANIGGVQQQVPTGLVQQGEDCVTDVCVNINGVQTQVPTGLVLQGTDCVDDVCDNIDGVQTAVPTGMTETNGVCTQTGNPTGEPAKLTITKVANKRKVHAGGKVKFTIRVKNIGKGDAGATRVCDYMPEGLVYVSATNGAFFSRGRICWKIKGLKAGQSVLIGKVTGQVVKGYQGHKLVNKACIMRSTSASAKPKTCAKAPVTVIKDETSQPTGGVTG